MVKTYGELVKLAREQHSPPMTRKHLAEKLKVTAPFITDIEKNRRLPSLDNQEKIKKLLVNEQLSAFLFDDLAAAGNEDKRIVAEDLAKDIRRKSALRDLIRTIRVHKLTTAQIVALTESIGGNKNGE